MRYGDLMGKWREKMMGFTSIHSDVNVGLDSPHEY